MRKPLYYYNFKNMKRALICLGVSLSISLVTAAQDALTRVLSMSDVIRLAQENSVSGRSYRNMYLSSYWSFRSFKADYLPSLSLSANIMNFNRSLVALQDYNTGTYSYRTNYNLSNSGTLSLSQKIAATGGSLQLYSEMSRLDQYQSSHQTTYYVQPINLYYLQPLWGFNSLKWNKKIEPNRYEVAKREYLERMEQVTLTASQYFWSYASARVSYDMALQNFAQSKRLYDMAKTRFAMGIITKDNLLQLELKVLNDSLSISSQDVSFRSARNRLCSYIGYQEDTDISLNILYSIPDIELSYDDVLDKSLNNSSFSLSQLISKLESEQSVDQAESQRGVTASLKATFGLSNNNDSFSAAFNNLQDQEIVGMSISIPILDWGQSEGRVKMARAQAETTKFRLEQSLQDYKQDLLVKVMQFNNQRTQCEISKRAADIAEESYRLALENFGNGSMSVTDLNSLQNERDNARQTYVNNVSSYWSYYFTIRGLTLFDYASNTNISTEFDNLIK